MIATVASKELIDHIRDRRSVMGAFILPLVGPLMVYIIFLFVVDLEREQPLLVPIAGASHAPQLVAFLCEHGASIEPAPKHPEAAVSAGLVDMVLVIDRGYESQFSTGRSAKLELLVDHTNHRGRKQVQQVERLLMAYAQQVTAQRLIVRGIAPEVAQPLAFDERDLATPERSTSDLLSVIPLFLMLAALVGGMNVAIDTTAGERERGSLEPLLLSPSPRSSLVLGKWLATSIAALIVAIAAQLVFMATISITPFEVVGLKVSLGAPAAAQMLVVVLPLAFFGAALQMLIATFARSFKEAQTYLNLLNLVPVLPSMFLMLSPATREWWMMLVPTMAQVTAVVDILRGDSIPAWHIALIWTSSFGFSAICLLLLTQLLRRERIIYGR